MQISDRFYPGTEVSAAEIDIPEVLEWANDFLPRHPWRYVKLEIPTPEMMGASIDYDVRIGNASIFGAELQNRRTERFQLHYLDVANRRYLNYVGRDERCGVVIWGVVGDKTDG